MFYKYEVMTWQWSYLLRYAVLFCQITLYVCKDTIFC